MNFLQRLFGGRPDTSLNDALVAKVTENLKIEPSEQLREVLAQGVDRRGNWSAEAVEAARRLLDRRSKGLDPEPVYRTVPRSAQDQAAREREAVAPGFPWRVLALDVGSRVYCHWRGQAGTIIRWQDEEERCYIQYDNGEGEWATLGMFE